MRRRLLLVGLPLVLLGCVGAEEGSPRGAVETPAPAPVESTSTSLAADVAGLCNGYLVLLRSGDPGPLREELDDQDRLDDLETMLSSEGEFQAIAAAALRLEEWVVARCADRFALGLEPAVDNSTALSTFMNAVAAGDRDQGAEVAWENVVSQFTWSVVDAGEIEIEGDSATMALGPTRAVVCEAEAGLVVACRFREG